MIDSSSSCGEKKNQNNWVDIIEESVIDSLSKTKMISLTFSVIGSTRASARSMSSFASLLKFSPPSREEVFKKYPKVL